MLTAPQGIDSLRLFSPFDLATRRSVIAAVSGGSDSTALLLLLDQHLHRFSPATRLTAVTIDHALRPESAAEAAAVAGLCEKIGIAHRILEWTGDKPATGIAAAAREARHDLLAEAAAKEGSDLVFTGHTANDQAETVLMRQARGDSGDGGRGLAGMAPATLFDGKTWFARPLLGIRREVLREFLRQRGVEWLDDPSNVNQRYERPRIRRQLGETDGDAATAAALEVAARAGRERQRLGEAAADLIRKHAEHPAPGLLRLHPDFFHAEAADAAIYGLRILLAVTGGTPHLPDAARTAALHAKLQGDDPVRAVLARTLVDRRKAGTFLLRERRGLPEGGGIDDEAAWDGRYRIARALAGPSRDRPFPGDAKGPIPDSLLRQAAMGEPVLAPDRTAIPILAPWARYLPSFDTAPARAVAHLIGAPEIPPLPFREHIESKA